MLQIQFSLSLGFLLESFVTPKLKLFATVTFKASMVKLFGYFIVCLFQQRCPGAVFILASCLVIGVASVSLCQLHTRILDKYLPKTKPDVAAKPLTEDSSTLETIQNFQFR